MDAVLLWGTGNVYRQQKNLIQSLEKNSELKILALVNQNGQSEDKDYVTVLPKEINKFSYDKIIITAEGKARNEIFEDAMKLGISAGRIIQLFDYLRESPSFKKLYKDTIQKQIKILEDLKDASDEQITSYEWMLQKICEYGVFPFGNESRQGINWSRWGLLQTPEEFAEYCIYIAGLKIESAIEIGVFRGRSSYFMCAIMARNNPSLSYTMVDICDGLDSFEQYQMVLPNMKKCIPSSSKDYEKKEYDFVFIDADHSYDGSMEDYMNVGQYARQLTVFHDIYGHEYDHFNGGIVRTWEEVCTMTEANEHKIFSANPQRWMGIGCVVWN